MEEPDGFIFGITISPMNFAQPLGRPDVCEVSSFIAHPFNNRRDLMRRNAMIPVGQEHRRETNVFGCSDTGIRRIQTFP